jgi:hypothetical protein
MKLKDFDITTMRRMMDEDALTSEDESIEQDNILHSKPSARKTLVRSPS